MKKYFGTDGIRGVANDFLNPELSFRLGRVLGYLVKNGNKERKYIYVGKDTRLSSPLLEYSLISGILSSGVDVKRLHLTPTPCVAYLTASTEAAMGVMVSASHNPYYDNGIKIFAEDGMKLTDEQELEIEKLMDSDDIPRVVNDEVGIVLNRHESVYQYIESLFFSVEERFDGIRIGLDCANGSTSVIAKRLFTRLGAEVVVLNDEPNGKNINENCGATHPEEIQNLVKSSELDFGFAFDGDGDRVIAVDHEGSIIDGDHLIYIFAKEMKERGILDNNLVSTTVMSNMGLYKSLKKIGVTHSQTNVGDRYVLRDMLKNGAKLGGEQSGHIIMLNHNTCGDGLLVALQLTSLIALKRISLKNLAKDVTKYPQKLGKVSTNDKIKVMEDTSLTKLLAKAKKELAQDGRVIIRPSGTEPVIRVMVEAQNIDLCEKYYDLVFKKIQSLS